MVSIVNGYFCATGCDERLAKKNIDPRNPHNDPVKQEQLDAKDPQKVFQKEIEKARDSGLEAKGDPNASRDAAVVLGGSLATTVDGTSSGGASGDGAATGGSATSGAGQRSSPEGVGTLLDVFA